jgi:hypothetical protein
MVGFYDKLSELRLKEGTRYLVTVPSDADHFLPCLSQFITYTHHTTKQLVRHLVSNFTLPTRISSTSRSRESSISKKENNHAINAHHQEHSLEWRGEGQRDLGLSRAAESKGQPNEYFI